MSKTLVLHIKVASDMEEAEEKLVKESIAALVEDHDSGAVVTAEWQEDQE